MPNSALTNLTSGEVSPALLGRPDVARYPNAALRLENFLLTTTGMLSYRPGFQLMGRPKFPYSKVRLLPFQFSDQQGNLIEAGEKYARIWHTLGQVLDENDMPVEMVTPFPASELDLLGYTQSADFLFVVHEQRGLFTIQRHDLDEWVFKAFQLIDGPYGKENADAGLSLTLGAPSGDDYPVTAAGFDEEPFGTGDEGCRLIRVLDGSDWKWLIVKTVSDGNTVVATSQSGTITQQAYTDWRLGLYSNRLGWPAAALIHEQRLVLAGPASIPDRLDGSAIAGFDNFAPTSPLVDNGAWGYALGSRNVNRILSLGASNDLLAFTAGSEHRISGDSTGIAITPTQVWQKPISPDGASRIPPIEVGNAQVFIDKYALNLRAISYDVRFQNYAPDNLTLLADHMSAPDADVPGFKALAWQGNPIGTIWTIRGNWELAGAIYDPKENVLGFHRHPMGMPDALDAEPQLPPAEVESIQTMKGPTYDELWAVVKRDLPAGTLRTVERMGRPGLWYAPFERQSFLDCSLQLRNTPTADLVPAAATGTGVSFRLQNVTGGFAFTADHVGRFLKQRYLAGKTVRGRPIYRTGIAKVTARLSDTEVTADILAPFKNALPIAAGLWGLTTTRITGLDHLEGQRVTVVSDGRVVAGQTVTGGAIDNLPAGWEITAGLPYLGIMVTLPIDPGPSAAVGMGRDVRIEKGLLRVLNSLGGEFASLPETDEQPVRWEAVQPYTQVQAAPSAAPVPFSGVKKVFAAGEWTREGQIAIRQTQPLPLNVQLVVTHLYAPHVQP